MSFVRVDNDESFQALLQDIFTDDFMRENTRFQTFEGFRYSSAVIANWDADPMVYNEALLDYFVKESTVFPAWEDMVRAAADRRFGSGSGAAGGSG